MALWIISQATLFGLGSFILMSMSLWNCIRGREEWSTVTGSLAMVIPSAAFLILGAFIWFRANWLGKRMVSDDPSPVSRNGFRPQTAMAVGTFIVGVFLFAESIGAVIRQVLRVTFSVYTFAEWWSDINWRTELFSSCIILAFSLWLIFGSRMVVKLVRTIQRQ